MSAVVTSMARIAAKLAPMSPHELENLASDLLNRSCTSVNIGEAGRLIATVASIHENLQRIVDMHENNVAAALRLIKKNEKLSKALETIADDETMTVDHLRGFARGVLDALPLQPDGGEEFA